jgi:AmmeMemoRadiSam system protein B
MASALECPRLRSGLTAFQDRNDSRFILLGDQLRLGPQSQRLTIGEFVCVQMFDGQRSLRDLQVEAMRQLGGQFLPMEQINALVQKLDEALFLDSPRLRDFLAQRPVREPVCIGCYEGEPEGLRRQLTALFTGPNGPGLPRDVRPDGRIRAALIPHIDYHRGGSTFAWGFKEVFERTDASLFVIIGTSHYSQNRFTLTRQDFRTPLGIAHTDQAYIDRLAAHYGAGLFDDPVAHLPEHSIELEVVFLQFWYNQRRPFRIVPLVVGSFQDCIAGRVMSSFIQTDIGRMIEALRRTEAETQEPICYIISGDLAHVGPKFGDPLLVNEPFLKHCRQQDYALIRRAQAVDMLGYFQVIAGENDRRRICGFPPTYTLLEAIRPRGGKLLHYDQYVHPRGEESVSFAAMAFDR